MTLRRQMVPSLAAFALASTGCVNSYTFKSVSVATQTRISPPTKTGWTLLTASTEGEQGAYLCARVTAAKGWLSCAGGHCIRAGTPVQGVDRAREVWLTIPAQQSPKLNVAYMLADDSLEDVVAFEIHQSCSCDALPGLLLARTTYIVDPTVPATSPKP